MNLSKEDWINKAKQLYVRRGVKAEIDEEYLEMMYSDYVLDALELGEHTYSPEEAVDDDMGYYWEPVDE